MGIKNKQLKASFTIEASLVIPIIMFLIVITIYMGFYLHDISIIKACAYSAGLDASFGKKGLHESAVEKINDARLFMASGTSVWTTNRNEYSVKYIGNLYLPFFTLPLAMEDSKIKLERNICEKMDIDRMYAIQTVNKLATALQSTD